MVRLVVLKNATRSALRWRIFGSCHVTQQQDHGRAVGLAFVATPFLEKSAPDTTATFNRLLRQCVSDLKVLGQFPHTAKHGPTDQSLYILSCNTDSTPARDTPHTHRRSMR